jgi:hypothetical protein
MFFERDLLHRHVACKCLQCGFILAYLWTEPGGKRPEFELAGRLGDDSMLLADEA